MVEIHEVSILSKKTIQFFKWATHLKRHFAKEDTQVAKKAVKGYSWWPVIREMSTDPTKGCPVSGAAGGNAKWYNPFGKEPDGSLKSETHADRAAQPFRPLSIDLLK